MQLQQTFSNYKLFLLAKPAGTRTIGYFDQNSTVARNTGHFDQNSAFARTSFQNYQILY